MRNAPAASTSSPPAAGLTQRAILRFWAPLAAQWLMMGVEGPFLAAVIARMADPTLDLAAYGVAFAFAILIESPVIMLMSASTALVQDAHSYRRLRNFTNALNVACTLVMLLVLTPPVFDVLMRGLLNLPGDVSDRVYGALWLLLPWPAAIGYRRFLQGVLIRAGRTRLVAYGTALRLTAMIGVALAVRALFDVPGTWVGAAALTAGVTTEAAAVRLMAHRTVRALLAPGRPAPIATGQAAAEAAAEAGAGAEEVTGASYASRAVNRAEATSPAASLEYREIARFYYPLALTSLLALTVQPLLTFFMGRAPAPVESLAVFPVVNVVTFLFRAPGISLQEAAIALLGPRFANYRALTRFGAALALVTTGGLALLAFTPLARLWFGGVSGLPPELAAAAVAPAAMAVGLPGLTVLMSLQQAVLVQGRNTRPITWASALEVTGIAVLFPLLAWGAGVHGATAAFAALVGGRLLANLLLLRHVATTRAAAQSSRRPSR